MRYDLIANFSLGETIPWPRTLEMILEQCSHKGTASSIRDCLKMRSRTKECHTCRVHAEALYRCRYDGLRDWLFLCGKCLAEVKAKHEKTYQYGGTWKRKKR